jgi:hypothetical protein
MKALTLFSFLLLLNATSVFSQEICEDEKNSIVELSADIKKADQKLKMKNLMNWYKSKVEMEENEVPYLVTNSIVDLSVNDCSEKKDFLGIEYVFVKQDCGNTKNHQQLVAPLKKGDKKSNNKFLAQIFSKKDGSIVLVDEIPGMMSGKMFVVHKKMKDGNMVHYTINTSVNAALNPVQVIDEGKKKAQTTISHEKTFSVGVSFGNNNGFGW